MYYGSYGYSGYGYSGYGSGGYGYTLILVLFILLVIVGCACY